MFKLYNDVSANKELPSIPQMAANLVQTAGAVASNVVHGHAPMVPDEESARRFTICEACTSFIKESARCTQCGCAMQFKVRLNGARCPINKW